MGTIAKVVRPRSRLGSMVAVPGMRKNDLVAEIYATGIRGAQGFWGDYPAIVPMAPSGMDATAPHLTWDDRPMQPNEATFFEIAGAHRRYQCPQSRTRRTQEVNKKTHKKNGPILNAFWIPTSSRKAA